MYIRADHAEAEIRVLRHIIRENPLGMLTTGIRSTTYPFLQSSHIPFVLDVHDESSETELGCLRGHLARANPQSKAFIETLTSEPQPGNTLEDEVLVIFTVGAHHYVTPKFYTETKPASGKVVPTWNYTAVQAYGKAKIYFDSKVDETSCFLDKQISDLSHHNETTTMGFTGGGRPTEWKVSDAPERYIEILKKNIIGIQISIERLEGKFKMSQELSEGDRDGVVKGFASLGSDVGQDMSRMVKLRGELKGQK
ncbi:probable transcriptional regulator [Cephalotrichum gorgonifer]|uniref:Probable transcriptional regulator n=1 Tax=Cephalotrichum gorgonifer TaxID=2041049 RepID=A0AAE8MZE9_9PEZI|nr:probable transcriptional regulator [Cephalotrichum gorgonifer]